MLYSNFVMIFCTLFYILLLLAQLQFFFIYCCFFLVENLLFLLLFSFVFYFSPSLLYFCVWAFGGFFLCHLPSFCFVFRSIQRLFSRGLWIHWLLLYHCYLLKKTECCSNRGVTSPSLRFAENEFSDKEWKK